MPTYKVTDPVSGVTLKLTGDSPPTEAELEDMFSQFAVPPKQAVAPDATQMRVGIPGTDVGFSFDVPQGVGEYFSGMGKSALDRVRGIVQAGADLVGADQLAGDIAQTVAEENELTKNAGGWFTAGEITGDLASTALVPMGTAGTVGKAMLKAAPIGFGIAATEVQESDDPYLRQASRIQQGLTGAGFAAGTAGILSKVGAIVNARRAKKLSDKEIYSNLTKLSKEYNIPLSLGDVSGPSSVPARLEVAMERLPIIGTAPFRRGQQKAARNAVNVFINKFGNLDDDISTRINLAAGDKLTKMRAIAGKAYKNIAEDFGDDIIATPRLNKAAQDILNRKLSPQTVQKGGGVVDEIKKYAEELNLPFRFLRSERDAVWKELGDMSRKYANSDDGARFAGFFDDLKTALKTDLDDAAKLAGGETLKKYSRADKFYRKHVIPFTKRGPWKAKFAALENEEGGRAVSTALNIMRQRDSNSARQLWSALTVDGRRAVRLGMLKEAFKKATSSSDDLFSPSVFMRELKKYNIGFGKQSAVDVAFRGASKTELDGFMNLMQHIKRAGQYTENAPTGGNRLVDWLLPAGAGAFFVSNPAGAAAATGGLGLMSALFTTNFGRNALFKLSRARTPDKVANILGEIFKQAPKWAALTPPEFMGEE